MTNEPKHKRYGDTIGEFLALSPNALADETVGLWSIVPAGRRGFGLAGPQLDDFVARYIVILLNAGALPARTAFYADGRAYWEAQTQYGSTPQIIATAIVHEWHAAGSTDPEWDYLRFMLPKYLNRPIVKT